MGEVTYDLNLLAKSRAKWDQSPGVRVVYRSLFDEAMAHAPKGAVLEIGAGAGFLKEAYPEVVTSDIVITPYVDRELSAYAIDESGEKWGTIIAMDVLHHLREPLVFLESAARSLQPDGRIILVEPAGTIFGRFFYGLFHQEPCVPGRLEAPYRFEADDADGNFANMGMGWALFQRDRDALDRILAAMNLNAIVVRYRDVLAYPATGGLSRKQMLPTGALRFLLGIEHRLPQWLLRCLGLRMIIVLERADRKSPALGA